MVFACKKTGVARGSLTWLVLLAIPLLSLLLRYPYDAPLSSSGMLTVGKAKIKTPPQPKFKVEITSVDEWRDQTAKINPSLLRVDFKQNLLVWPNVSGDLTRSPPSSTAVRLFS
jgi:hypothetical protein